MDIAESYKRQRGGEMTPKASLGEWLGREDRVVGGRVAELRERGCRARLERGWSGSLPDDAPKSVYPY
jgi:hypothetical protein